MVLMMGVIIFAYMGFEHVVANSALFAMALLEHPESVNVLQVGKIFFFSLIGNDVGGGLVIGLFYAYLNDHRRERSLSQGLISEVSVTAHIYLPARQIPPGKRRIRGLDSGFIAAPPCPSVVTPGQSVCQDHRAWRHPWFRWAQTPPARGHPGGWWWPVGSKSPMCRTDAWGAAACRLSNPASRASGMADGRFRAVSNRVVYEDAAGKLEERDYYDWIFQNEPEWQEFLSPDYTVL